LTRASRALASSDRPRNFPYSMLLRFVEQLASDQHPAYLRRSGADLIELGVAPQASRRELIDVPVAAERLDRLARHPRRFLGCIEYRTRGIFARSLAAIARSRDSVHVSPAGVHGWIHVRYLSLHELEFSDRLPELLALVNVREHLIHACCHDSKRPAGEHRTLVVKPAHQHAYPAPFLRKDIFFGNLAVLED